MKPQNRLRKFAFEVGVQLWNDANVINKLYDHIQFKKNKSSTTLSGNKKKL